MSLSDWLIWICSLSFSDWLKYVSCFTSNHWAVDEVRHACHFYRYTCFLGHFIKYTSAPGHYFGDTPGNFTRNILCHFIRYCTVIANHFLGPIFFQLLNPTCLSPIFQQQATDHVQHQQRSHCRFSRNLQKFFYLHLQHYMNKLPTVYLTFLWNTMLLTVFVPPLSRSLSPASRTTALEESPHGIS